MLGVGARSRVGPGLSAGVSLRGSVLQPPMGDGSATGSWGCLLGVLGGLFPLFPLARSRKLKACECIVCSQPLKASFPASGSLRALEPAGERLGSASRCCSAPLSRSPAGGEVSLHPQLREGGVSKEAVSVRQGLNRACVFIFLNNFISFSPRLRSRPSTRGAKKTAIFTGQWGFVTVQCPAGSSAGS